MSFAGNDYLSPAQECTIPIINIEDPTVGEIKIHSRQRKKSTEEKPDLTAIQINLKDCLACSGCVTSAETVLINRQSSEQFLAEVSSGSVVSISSQSIASIASFFKLSYSSTYRKLFNFFTSLGAKSFLSTDNGQRISSILTAREFLSNIERYSTSQPFITSSCPAVVCFIEKTADTLIPSLGSTYSPMSVTGAEFEKHVSVQPCFDRKLEAARDQLSNHTSSVLSTKELIILLEQRSFLEYNESDIDVPAPASGSTGNYIEYIIRELQEEDPYLTFEIGPGRNKDVTIFKVTSSKYGQLQFSRMTGYRNIQNLQRRIRNSINEDIFIELFACPSGCTHGGAQMNADSALEMLQALWQDTPVEIPEKALTIDYQSCERPPKDSEFSTAVVLDW